MLQVYFVLLHGAVLADFCFLIRLWPPPWSPTALLYILIMFPL